MMIEVRYFASVREALGARETVEVEEGTTVGRLRDALIERGAAYADVLARGRALRMALDQTLCDEAAVIAASSREVAFFPPVTGG